MPAYPIHHNYHPAGSENSYLYTDNNNSIKQENGDQVSLKRAEDDKPVKPLRKKKLGKKKPIIRKHKPASNSKFLIENVKSFEKPDGRPKTEVWEWKKIQEVATNDTNLNKDIAK